MNGHGPQQLDRIGDKRETAGWVIGLVPMMVVCGALLAAGRLTSGVDAPHEAVAVPPAKAKAAIPVQSAMAPPALLPPAVPARGRRLGVKIAYPPQTVVVTSSSIVVRSDMHERREQDVEIITCDYPVNLPPPRTICEPEAVGESGIALAWTRDPRPQDGPREDCEPVRREVSVAQSGESAAGQLTGP